MKLSWKKCDYWNKLNEIITEKLIILFSTKQYCDENMEAKVKYTLHVFLNETQKMILLVICFFYEKRLLELGVLFCTIALFRSYVGGVHCNTVGGCFLMSLFSFHAMIGLANVISYNCDIQNMICVFAIVVIWRGAPIQSVQRPVYNREKRLQFKAQAITVICSIIMITAYIPVYYRKLIISAVFYQTLEAMVVLMVRRFRKKQLQATPQ